VEPQTENEMLDEARRIVAAIGYFPLGHYHSPFPSDADVDRAQRARETATAEIPGLDLNADRQLELLEVLAPHVREAQLPREANSAWRFSHDNSFFGNGDADSLHAMIRHLRPRRIVEVGSGFSSALTLDTNDRSFDGSIECTFIEPEPERLIGLLRPDDLRNATFIRQPVQDVPLSVFDALEANDILFIDSSHVVKAGSDVNHEIFEILPRLKSDVHVHFHDIHYPFEYTREWIAEGRAWSESYLLRAFLQFNHAFEVLLFCDYLRLFHPDEVRETIPSLLRSPPGSFWLRRR
jgi:hypothetical protein